MRPAPAPQLGPRLALLGAPTVVALCLGACVGPRLDLESAGRDAIASDEQIAVARRLAAHAPADTNHACVYWQARLATAPAKSDDLHTWLRGRVTETCALVDGPPSRRLRPTPTPDSSEPTPTPLDQRGTCTQSQGERFWSRVFRVDGGVLLGGIAVDRSGIGIIGSIDGRIDFGEHVLPGSNDMFLAKLDPQGQHVWSKNLGGPAEGVAIAFSPAGPIILAGTLWRGAEPGGMAGPAYYPGRLDLGGRVISSERGGDFVLAQLDSEGRHMWNVHAVSKANTLNAASPHSLGLHNPTLVHSIGVEESGALVVTGNPAKMLDLGGGTLAGGGDRDIFVVRYTGAGRHVWSRRFGSRCLGECVGEIHGSLAVEHSGDVIIGAYFNGTIDFGATPGAPSQARGLHAAKLSAEGRTLWTRQFGGAAQYDEPAVAIDALGSVFLASRVGGEVDFGGGALPVTAPTGVAIAKLDAQGKHVWSKRLGGWEASSPPKLAVDLPSGDLFLAVTCVGDPDLGGGPLSGTTPSSRVWRRLLVARFDASGRHQWSRLFGAGAPHASGGGVEIGGLAVGPDGDLFLAGAMSGGSMDFGCGALTCSFTAGEANRDVFLAKLRP